MYLFHTLVLKKYKNLISYFISTLVVVSTAYSSNLNPIPNNQKIKSENLGFSIICPANWKIKETPKSVNLASEGAIKSNRTTGADVNVSLLVQVKDPNVPLNTVWKLIPEYFSDINFSTPLRIDIVGKKGLRSVFSDPSDNSYGWVILTKHKNRFYLIITKVFGKENWSDYAEIFNAIINSLYFLN